MNIISTLPFVITNVGDIGIAADGSYASQAWRISDEAFNNIGAQKFVWIAPDGNQYTDHRDRFRRPTEFEIRQNISAELKAKAIEIGLITE